MNLESLGAALAEFEKQTEGTRAIGVPIIGVRCHYCSKFYPESEIIRFGESMVRCLKCDEKHTQALNVLAGNPPQACGECGVSWDQLRERTPGDHVKMYVHLKDGLYQLLCDRCDAVYVEKRKDLYGPTRFGWERKLS